MESYVEPLLKTKTTKTTQLYSVFLAFYPVLCIYKAIGRFTVGDILLILFLFYALLSGKRMNRRIFRVFAVFISYSIISFIVANCLYVNDEFNATLFRLLKLMFYTACVIYVSQDYIDICKLKTWVVRISIFGSIYIFIQYTAYYAFDKILHGWIPGFPVYLEEYTMSNYEVKYSYLFRPTSFFLEPAMFCQYAVIGLVFVLFTNEKELKKSSIINGVIILFGIIMSTSGQGLFLAGIIIIVFLVKIFRNKLKAYLILGSTCLCAYITYLTNTVVNSTVNRLLIGSDAFNARVGSFKFISEIDGISLLIGYGYGKTPLNEYLVGGAYVWYGCGLVGFVLAVCMFVQIYRIAGCITGKMITFIFFLMFLGTALFYNYMFFWFFSLALCNCKNNEKLRDKYLKSISFI